MKKLHVLAALALSAGLASAAFADTSSNSNTNTTVSTTATAGELMMLSGSVGAANCAWAANLGPIGVSNMADICKREIAADYWAKRGRFDIADMIMAQSPITDAAVKALADQAAAATTASTMSAPAPAESLKVTVAGLNYVLSGATLASYNDCDVVLFQGADGAAIKGQKAGCN